MRFIEKLKHYFRLWFYGTKPEAKAAPAKPVRKPSRREELITIYRRGAELMPAESLVVHQKSEPERVAKIKAQAQARRERRTNRLSIRKPSHAPDF